MKLRWWIVGYFIALAIALLSPLAASSPDGLERVAENNGFMGQAEGAPYAIIADYVFPGIGNEAVATILAGIIGVTVVYVLVAGGMFLLYRAVSQRDTQSRQEP